MPRVYLNQQEKLNHRLARWVYGELKTRKMSQLALAKEMQISQQALSMKLRIERFTFEDLCTFIRVFKPETDDLERLLGV